jgi:predicted HicB family RNase H-like nuclease
MGKEYTEAQKRASLKYQQGKAQIKFTVDKKDRDKYQALAESKGLSLTALIVQLLEKEVE